MHETLANMATYFFDILKAAIKISPNRINEKMPNATSRPKLKLEKISPNRAYVKKTQNKIEK